MKFAQIIKIKNIVDQLTITGFIYGVSFLPPLPSGLGMRRGGSVGSVGRGVWEVWGENNFSLLTRHN